MRRDLLAAGAPKANFAGGLGETDFTRNVMSDEDRAALDAQIIPLVQETPKPKKKFIPLGETILVRRAEPEEIGTGILITEKIEKERPAEGEILAVGADVSTVKIGDNVVFGKYAGAEYKLNGEILLLMDIKEVQGILAEESVDDSAGLSYHVSAGVPVGEA